MSSISIIKGNRKQILTAEIGALLHDIGKFHPDFIEKQSADKNLGYNHADIDEILNDELIDLIKNEKFKIDEETDVYSLITQHHSNRNSDILRLLKDCDRLDSADDKGIVRKKQVAENTIISSPFGYRKERIDLRRLRKQFEDLSYALQDLFMKYIHENMTLSLFRRALISRLETALIHALAETRIPANDVTLWDHSHSTASRFKSILCRKILENNSNRKPEWRLIGFCWDGMGFIKKGKKIADNLKRQSILDNIRAELKRKFEDEIPIGNMVYWDINGAYFTFPGLDKENALELGVSCASEGYAIIRELSDDEIWPFVTLSKKSRSMTILTGELKFAALKRGIPKISPTLFFEGDAKVIEYSYSLPEDDGEGRRDICPVCRLRIKDLNEERCGVCEKRRKGRIKGWSNNRKDTIWIDEVADVNNRIALISLNFDLDRWLDGTMLETIYSQTYEDWLKSLMENKGKIEKRIEEKIERIDNEIEGMKNARDPIRVEKRLNSKKKEKKSLQEKLRLLNSQKADSGYIREVIENFLCESDSKDEKALILDTFLEDISVTSNNFEDIWKGITYRIRDSDNKVEDILKFFFTQNPSPARLYRIWNETYGFIDSVLKGIKENLKWKRLKLICEGDIPDKIQKEKLFIINIEGLEPENLLVFRDSDGNFYTAESLMKYRHDEKEGPEAVEYALKTGIKWISPEDGPYENVLSGDNFLEVHVEMEEYHPLIEITESPLSLKMIIPASESIKVIEFITSHYNERFQKVIGKLPLNIGLLVAKRKFPIYVLLDACERLLNDAEFRKTQKMDPWWTLECLRSDPYYGFYPISRKDRYSFHDMERITSGGLYVLQPGYFDFEMLLGTADRYSINYDGGRRASMEYRTYSARPLHLYRFSDMMTLWGILKDNLSNSQMDFLENSIKSKLGGWNEFSACVFEKFAFATLRNAFDVDWDSFRSETRSFIMNSALDGLLIDTLVLCRHVLKEGENET